jgi:ABC-2 type transport system permease protein
MTPSGFLLVARQEFRMRLRTGRWRWLLGAWVLIVGGFTALLDLSLETGYAIGDAVQAEGVPLFGFLMLFVLGLILVISPALTSQSINGDRERGTLATLQVTRLGPVEIALGKLLAGWGVGLVALALTLPFAGYAIGRGGITIGRVASVYAVVAILVGVVCAVSQALSALLARSITSALLSYLAVAALTIGTFILLALIAPLITEERTATSPDGFTYTYEIVREDKVWWLIAPNPFVVVADSAPHVEPRITSTGEVIRIDDYDPLSAIAREVRLLKLPPAEGQDYYDDQTRVFRDNLAVWPYGLAFNLLLGLGAVAVTAARLRTPSRRVARGVRIA